MDFGIDSQKIEILFCVFCRSTSPPLNPITQTMAFTQTNFTNVDCELTTNAEHYESYMNFLIERFGEREGNFNEIYNNFNTEEKRYYADEANGIVDLAEEAAIFFENEEENWRLLGEEDGTSQLMFEQFLFNAIDHGIRTAMDTDRPPSNTECDAMLEVGSQVIDAGISKELAPRYISSPEPVYGAALNETSEANYSPIFAQHGMIPTRLTTIVA